MPLEADTSTESNQPDIPDWLKDDDEGTTQATADESAAPDAPQGADQPDDAFAAAQQRDQAGRFTRSESSPTGYVPQDVRAQAPAATAQETTEAPEAESFTYRADGREYDIPGMRVPEAQADYVRQLLAEGMHHRTTWQSERQQFEAEKQQAMQWVQSQQATFQSATAILQDLFTKPDKLAEMYADWQTQGPALLERAKAAGLEAELNFYRQQDGHAIAQQAQEATRGGLWDSMGEMIDSQFPNVFDKNDMTELYGELANDATLVQVADRDYPEYGFQAGDVLLDEPALYGRMAMRAREVVQRDRAARMAADKIAKTSAKNAATLGKTRRPPPTIGARTGAVPAGGTPPIVTAKDWQRHLDEDDD